MSGKNGMNVLRLALGVVILIEAVMFVLPSAAQGFAHTHLPGFVRLVLAFGEIIGCVLLLIPGTVARGAWVLLVVFGIGILLHLVHGQYAVGNLVIYAAAAFAIAVGG